MGRSRSFVTYNGTFTTIAGVPTAQSALTCPGPLQTGGVTGTFKGYDVVVVTGGVFHLRRRPVPIPVIHVHDGRDLLPGCRWLSAGAWTITNGWEYQYRTAA